MPSAAPTAPIASARCARSAPASSRPRAMKRAMIAAFAVAPLFGAVPHRRRRLADRRDRPRVDRGRHRVHRRALPARLSRARRRLRARRSSASSRCAARRTSSSAACPCLAWWAAIPVGALATAILVVNNVRDRATDARAGKRTLAVRFGRRGAIVEYAALARSCVRRSDRPGRVDAIPWCLLPVLTVPLAWRRLRDLIDAADWSSLQHMSRRDRAADARARSLVRGRLGVGMNVVSIDHRTRALADQCARRGAGSSRARGTDRRGARRLGRDRLRRSCAAPRHVDRHARATRSRCEALAARLPFELATPGHASAIAARDHFRAGRTVRDRDRAAVGDRAAPRHERREPVRRAAAGRDRAARSSSIPRPKRAMPSRAACAASRSRWRPDGMSSASGGSQGRAPTCRLRLDANRGWPVERDTDRSSRARRAADRVRRGAVHRCRTSS